MRKKILFGTGGLLVVLAGVYFYFATRTYTDTADVKPDFTVEAMDFLKEFEKDSKMANQKYTERIIQVTGLVSAREKADTTINIKMIDSTTGSYIIFAFQQEHLDEAANIRQGDQVSIKGSCSGGIHSMILGSNFISFKRSALVN